MNPEQNISGEDVNINRSWDTLFYILGSIAICCILSMAAFYWHASITKDGLGYPYALKNTFPGLEFHEGITMLFMVLWAFALFITPFLSPLALLNKRKVSWKAFLFCIASHASVFLYFKFSDFLDWIIT